MRSYKFKFWAMLNDDEGEYEVEVLAQANPPEPDVGYDSYWFELISVHDGPVDITGLLEHDVEEELLDQAAMSYNDDEGY